MNCGTWHASRMYLAFVFVAAVGLAAIPSLGRAPRGVQAVSVDTAGVRYRPRLCSCERICAMDERGREFHNFFPEFTLGLRFGNLPLLGQSSNGDVAALSGMQFRKLRLQVFFGNRRQDVRSARDHCSLAGTEQASATNGREKKRSQGRPEAIGLECGLIRSRCRAVTLRCGQVRQLGRAGESGVAA